MEFWWCNIHTIEVKYIEGSRSSHFSISGDLFVEGLVLGHSYLLHLRPQQNHVPVWVFWFVLGTFPIRILWYFIQIDKLGNLINWWNLIVNLLLQKILPKAICCQFRDQELVTYTSPMNFDFVVRTFGVSLLPHELSSQDSRLTSNNFVLQVAHAKKRMLRMIYDAFIIFCKDSGSFCHFFYGLSTSFGLAPTVWCMIMKSQVLCLIEWNEVMNFYFSEFLNKFFLLLYMTQLWSPSSQLITSNDQISILKFSVNWIGEPSALHPKLKLRQVAYHVSKSYHDIPRSRFTMF